MSDNFKQQKAFALIVVIFLFFIWSQNTLSPFADHVSKGASGQGQGAQNAALQNQASQQGGGALMAGNGAQVASNQLPNQVNPAQAPQVPAAQNAALLNQAAPSANTSPLKEQVLKSESKTISNDKYSAKISLLGGRLTSLTLNDYKDKLEIKSGAYEAISLGPNSTGELGVYLGGVNDAAVLYKVTEAEGFQGANLSVTKPSSLTLEGQLPSGQNIVKVFKFEPGSYKIGLDVAASAVEGAPSSLEIEISKFVPNPKENEAFADNETFVDPNSGGVWFDGEKASREGYKNLKKRGLQPLTLENMSWLSLSEKYFTQVLMSEGKSASGVFSNREDDFIARLSQSSAVGAAISGSFSYWALPKDYEVLKEINLGFERNVDFGWAGFLSEPLLRILHWFNKVLGNFGLAIVALTILVRLLLYPLNAVQYKSMKAMQKLQPEMKRIRENVKDKQQQQTQLMSLYQKEGVNPFGGCFPMILQFPIVIGLYFGLMVDFGLRHAPFAFWIKDLSIKESLGLGGIGLPIMAILMVVSMMYQTWTTPSAADPAQKKMMLIMPLFFGFFFATFPAGLTLYWLTSTLIGLGQQKGMAREGGSKYSALKITLSVSAAVFAFAFLFVKLGEGMA